MIHGPLIPDPGDPPSCLALHGLGGGPYELRPVVEALHREGSRVLSPVLPGHDGEGPVMPSSSWTEWAASAEASFDHLAAFGQPVVVVGFSTGATLALWLATRRRVARLVLLAPFLAIRFSGLIPFHPSVYIRPFARMMPDLPRRSPAARDPVVRRRLHQSAVFRTFSLPATLSALDLIEHVKPLVPQIQTPALILQGRHDTVVAPSGAAWLVRHLGSKRKTLLWLPRSDHLLALDHDRDQVIAETVKFVLDREE